MLRAGPPLDTRHETALRTRPMPSRRRAPGRRYGAFGKLKRGLNPPAEATKAGAPARGDSVSWRIFSFSREASIRY